MEYSLAMTFVTTSGDKSSLTITGVKSDLSQAEVSTLMDIIIEKGVFLTKSGALTAKYGAQMIQRKTTKFEVQ